MSRRARYVGPFDEVRVSWPPGETVGQETVTVQKGHELPKEVPAAVRDELLAGADWSEVGSGSTTTARTRKPRKPRAKKPTPAPTTTTPAEDSTSSAPEPPSGENEES